MEFQTFRDWKEAESGVDLRVKVLAVFRGQFLMALMDREHEDHPTAVSIEAEMSAEHVAIGEAKDQEKWRAGWSVKLTRAVATLAKDDPIGWKGLKATVRKVKTDDPLTDAGCVIVISAKKVEDTVDKAVVDAINAMIQRDGVARTEPNVKEMLSEALKDAIEAQRQVDIALGRHRQQEIDDDEQRAAHAA